MNLDTNLLTGLFFSVVQFDEPNGQDMDGRPRWDRTVMGIPLHVWVGDTDMAWQIKGPDWSLGFRFAPTSEGEVANMKSPPEFALGYFYGRYGIFHELWVHDNLEAAQRTTVQINILTSHPMRKPSTILEFKENQ